MNPIDLQGKPSLYQPTDPTCKTASMSVKYYIGEGQAESLHNVVEPLTTIRTVTESPPLPVPPSINTRSVTISSIQAAAEWFPYAPDPLLTKIGSAEGRAEVERLIELRRSRGGEARKAMAEILTTQKHNMGQAISRIKTVYANNMTGDEWRILEQMTQQARVIDHVDDFIVLAFQYSMVVTFLHQKYHGKLPERTHRIQFIEGTTCQQVADLPYQKLLTREHKSDFYTQLRQCVSPRHDSDYVFRDSLEQLLAKDQVVLYPQFDELDESFFLQSAPLGFHPLGLISEPYIVADEFANDPANFFLHDQAHAALIENSSEDGFREGEKQLLAFFNEILSLYKTQNPEFHESLVRVLVYLKHERAMSLEEIFTLNSLGDPNLSSNLLFDIAPDNILTSEKDVEAFLWLQGFAKYVRQQSLEAALLIPPAELIDRYERELPLNKNDVRKMYAWQQLGKSLTFPENKLLRQIYNTYTCLSHMKEDIGENWFNSKVFDDATYMINASSQNESLLRFLKNAIVHKKIALECLPAAFVAYYGEALSDL